MPDQHPQSGRVTPIRRRRPLAQWPLGIVLLGVCAALVLIGTDQFRRGSIVLSGSVVLAMFLRLLLPERDAGMLANRTRRLDVSILGCIGLALTVFTFWVPPPN